MYIGRLFTDPSVCLYPNILKFSLGGASLKIFYLLPQMSRQTDKVSINNTHAPASVRRSSTIFKDLLKIRLANFIWRLH